MWERIGRLAGWLTEPGGWAARREGNVPLDALRTWRNIVRRHNLVIGTVLYIGANRGQNIPVLRHAYPEADIHCFEPQEAAWKDLTSTYGDSQRVYCWRLAFTDTTGDAPMWVAGTADVASSLLSPNDAMKESFPHVRDWSIETVAVTTADKWFREHGPLEKSILMLIDVQGSEANLIKGAVDLLQDVDVVVVEVMLTPTYEGAPDLLQMRDLLRQHGFALDDVVALGRDQSLAVTYLDAAFVRH